MGRSKDLSERADIGLDTAWEGFDYFLKLREAERPG
jgi:hypothetical protein